MTGPGFWLRVLTLCLPLVRGVLVVDFHGAAEYDVPYLASLVGDDLELTHIMLFNTSDKVMIEHQLDSVGFGGIFNQGYSIPATKSTVSIRDDRKVKCTAGKLTIAQTSISKFKGIICAPLSSVAIGAGGVGVIVVQGLLCSDSATGHSTSHCSLGVYFVGGATSAFTATVIQELCTQMLTDTWAECPHGGSEFLDKGAAVATQDMVEFESKRDCSNVDFKGASACRSIDVHEGG